MISQAKQIEKLLEQSEWTAEEKQWFLNLLENLDGSDLKEIMQRDFLDEPQNTKAIDPAISERLLKSIRQKTDFKLKQEKSKLVRIWTIRIVAACFVGFLFLGAFFWVNNTSKKPGAQLQVTNKKYKNDIMPGGNKAFLTLDDGSTIVLEEAKNGLLIEQGNTKIMKREGKLDYSSSRKGVTKMMYNTISTPRGGQYQVELPDGSKVWLNAASSLRFPTAFAGNERRVEITGEVYFEIAKNKTRPFVVSVGDAEIQVIGTQFNVMAYKEESSLQTTLLEGSVKFIADNNTATLKPGQQLQFKDKKKFKVVSAVNVSKVMAWKNGFFNFEESDFETIAMQLSRWYNVEIIYNEKINDLFYAEIPRNSKLSDVLKALELTGKINFKIDGTKIIVLP